MACDIGVRYFRPGELAEPRGEELRPMARPKIGGPAARPVKSSRPPGRPRSSSRLEDELARKLEQALAAELVGN